MEMPNHDVSPAIAQRLANQPKTVPALSDTAMYPRRVKDDAASTATHGRPRFVVRKKNLGAFPLAARASDQTVKSSQR